MDRIEAPTEQPGLRAGAIEGDAKRKDLTGPDQARRLHDVLGCYVIKSADLIVLAPTTPVLELLRCFGDRLLADLDVHKAVPSGLLVLAARVPPEGCPLPLQYCSGRRCFSKRGAALPL